jgi:hypothetical protein
MIDLLLAHADDHRPALERGLAPEIIERVPSPAPSPAPELWPGPFADNTEDPSSLPAQRWGVIAPEGPRGDRLLSLIEPLRRAREEEQGAKVMIYRVPSAQDVASAAAWKRRVYWSEEINEVDLPRYLLILGDLDEVSLELQVALAADVLVGRLAFTEDSGYEAYVNKILRFEKSPPVKPSRALFCTVRDGTSATNAGYRDLMEPALARCQALQRAGDLTAGSIVEVKGLGEGSLGDLLVEAEKADPSVLFTMSHGLGTPRSGWASAADQQALQGALSLGKRQRLVASDLAGKTFLPGGVWFMLACYGAGTPAESAYYPWIRRLSEVGAFPGPAEAVLAGLPRRGDRPFVAALPKAVLASPDGPLAVIGHMDLAWNYSFQEIDENRARGRTARFMGLLKALVGGARVGVAHRELLRFLADAHFEIAGLYQAEATAEARGAALPDGPAQRATKSHLWMLRNDLMGYVLLGDPAARLRARPAPIPERVEPAPVSFDAGMSGGSGESRPPPAPASEVAAMPPAYVMEEAVLAALRGEDRAAVAARHAIDAGALDRWVRLYMNAGRDALAQAREDS